MSRLYISTTQTLEGDDSNSVIKSSNDILINGNIHFFANYSVSGASLIYNLIPKKLSFLIATEDGGNIDKKGFNNPA